MDSAVKEKSVTMAREIREAMETLEVALGDGADEREIVEAKNVVASVLRSYKEFLDGLDTGQREQARKLFLPRIEAMAVKARSLS